MNKVMMGCLFVAVLAVPTFVQAQDTASGTLNVTGMVVSSISLTIPSAGGTFSGGGTDTATSALGSISKFGALPTGFSRTTTSSTWTIASTIGVTVEKANSASTSYTLNAKLGTAPATNVVWTVGAVVLNASTVSSLGTPSWGTTPTYAWSIEIPDSMSTATSIGNVITFSAISG